MAMLMMLMMTIMIMMLMMIMMLIMIMMLGDRGGNHTRKHNNLKLRQVVRNCFRRLSPQEGLVDAQRTSHTHTQK
jgi:uncharacterized membrane protein